ncbi:MAG: GGDEF domain-containing protein [Nitrospirae bacterium]|nr:GGDEF domain-containing protein [Nitrospirota bacterium]
MGAKSIAGLSIILLDIDYFKHYNDTHGHQGGDEVLRMMAEVIKKEVRHSDTVARYGGEEFVVISVETDKDTVVQLAERIRKGVEKSPFPLKETQPGGNLTVSLGVASFRDDANTVQGLIKEADDALYGAKESGRNRVWFKKSLQNK